MNQRFQLLLVHRYASPRQRIAQTVEQFFLAGVVQIQLAAARLPEGVRQNRPHGVLVGVQLVLTLTFGFRPDLHGVHDTVTAQVLDADLALDLLQHGRADFIILWRVANFT